MFYFIYLFYFEQYLFRGAQFSEAGLNGALMKKNNNNNKTIIDKTLEQLSIAEVLEAQFGLKWIQSAFLGQSQTYLNHACSSGPEEACSRSWLRCNLKEPWYLVVRASGRRSKSPWRVLKIATLHLQWGKRRLATRRRNANRYKNSPLLLGSPNYIDKRMIADCTVVDTASDDFLHLWEFDLLLSIYS